MPATSSTIKGPAGSRPGVDALLVAVAQFAELLAQLFQIGQ